MVTPPQTRTPYWHRIKTEKLQVSGVVGASDGLLNLNKGIKGKVYLAISIKPEQSRDQLVIRTKRNKRYVSKTKLGSNFMCVLHYQFSNDFNGSNIF